MHKELGGDTARTAGQNGARVYPIPCDVILRNKSWGKKNTRKTRGEAKKDGMGWTRYDRQDICSDGIYLPKKLAHDRLCSPGVD